MNPRPNLRTLSREGPPIPQDPGDHRLSREGPPPLVPPPPTVVGQVGARKTASAALPAPIVTNAPIPEPITATGKQKSPKKKNKKDKKSRKGDPYKDDDAYF
eukprot:TRINITY_DN4707_c0_g1_i1.p2 TRINITY_DN4707_c0_g1~~TRINITY_DN4707_c0_g1_i1.p2  ORF type:complete len:118 (+),score=12.57 TRINITY_DN4707_c0_g1_i1:49-354(+)